jgi:hypothetical protein
MPEIMSQALSKRCVQIAGQRHPSCYFNELAGTTGSRQGFPAGPARQFLPA